MKFLLTSFTALSFGSISFQLAQRWQPNQWQARAVVWLGALILAAFLCAPLWS
jgi:hypothetical protein